MKNLKFLPKLPTALIFLCLLALVFALFSGRSYDWIQIDSLLKLMPHFYTHISNFSISFMLYAGIGYFWLMFGVNFKYLIGLGLIILLCNFVYELWIPILNTPDLMDAYFGLAGTLFAFIFLLLTSKFGLNPNPA